MKLSEFLRKRFPHIMKLPHHFCLAAVIPTLARRPTSGRKAKLKRAVKKPPNYRASFFLFFFWGAVVNKRANYGPITSV